MAETTTLAGSCGRLDESDRLLALYRTGLLDTPADSEFDGIARMMALVFDTPFAAITLVDRSRQWFKALEGGLCVKETPRSESICTYTIAGDDILVVPDTLSDPRFCAIPLVAQAPHIRFYAGVPLRLSCGANIGALCVLGQQPAEITGYQREMLKLLGRQVVKLVEAHQRQQTHSWLEQFIARSNRMVSLLDIDARAYDYTNAAWEQRCAGGQGDALQALERLLPGLDASDLNGLADNSSNAAARWRNLQLEFPNGDRSRASVQFIPDSAPQSQRGARRKLLIVIDDESEIQLAQRKADEAAAKAHLLEQVATLTRNPVIITDAAGRVEWVNLAFQRTTGYGLHEVIGRTPGSALQGDETCPETVAHIREQLRAGSGVAAEILNYAKDGRRHWLELDIQPVHDQSGTLTHFIAVQTDITRRKEHEQRMSEAHAEAERVSRMKSRFLANVSHEIRTPLNGILGIAQYLDRQVPERFREDIQVLHRSGEHLLNLLNEMIDLSALESGVVDIHLKPFSPEQVMHEVFRLFEASAGAKSLELKLDLDSSLAGQWASGDAKRLRQVLMNLVGNAIKFTSAGSVTLACVRRPPRDGKMVLDFSVADTGAGIEKADQQRIFRRFTHLDSPGAGAGLGLAISRQILRQMHSSLTLTSAVGEGSCFAFQVEFALAQAPTEDASATELVEGADFADIGRILVVDDNQTNLRVMQGLLESLGAVDICLASSGRAALESPEALGAALVLVDISMPEMDGFEFLEQFRLLIADSADRPMMVACTALDGSSEREAIMARGFDAYLGKPVSLAALAELLQIRRKPIEHGALPCAAHGPASVISESLRQKMGGNDKLIRHFLELFLEHNDSHWQSIHRSIAEGDMVRLSRSIHTLKGHFGYFGVDHPGYCRAHEIDRLLKAGQVVTAEHIAAFEQAADALITGIRLELPQFDERQAAPASS